MSAITKYLHQGMPGPDGRCRHCGDRVTMSVSEQGVRVVDLADYGVCAQMTALERLEIDLEDAEDRVNSIRRQINRLQRQRETAS